MYDYKENELILQINLKSLCNLDCDYCLLPKHVKSQKESDKVIVDNTNILMEKIKNENYSVRVFAIFGAEPFTVGPETMAGVLNVMGDNFPETYLKIQTNGTLCTPKYMETFLKLFKYPERLVIGWSIDGVKDIHNKHRCDSWELLEQNFLWIKKNTIINTNIICTTNIEHYDGGAYEDELLNFINNMHNIYNTTVNVSFADLTIRGVGESHIGESVFSKKYADFIIKHNLIRFVNKLGHQNYCYRKGNDCDKVLIDLNQFKTYQCEKEFSPNKEFMIWKDKSISEVMSERASRTVNYKIAEECHSCEYWEWCRGGCPLKRDENGLAKICYVTKTCFDHIKNNLNPDWKDYLITGNITLDGGIYE